jgi:hypothetical protein
MVRSKNADILVDSAGTAQACAEKILHANVVPSASTITTSTPSLSSQSDAADPTPSSSSQSDAADPFAPRKRGAAADPSSKTKNPKQRKGNKQVPAGGTIDDASDLKRHQQPKTATTSDEEVPAPPVAEFPRSSKRRRRCSTKKWGRSATVNTHNVFTHFPKDPNCPVCQKGKAIKARCSRKSGDSEKPDSLPKPTAFGQMISADHAIFNEDFESRKHDTVALVVQDAFTYWLQAYPAKRKTADECYTAFRRFMGVGKEAGHCWSDGSEELKAYLNRLQWPHDSSTPNRPATNGIIERAMQRTKEGTSVCLVQSGLDDQWWDLAMQC